MEQVSLLFADISMWWAGIQAWFLTEGFGVLALLVVFAFAYFAVRRLLARMILRPQEEGSGRRLTHYAAVMRFVQAVFLICLVATVLPKFGAETGPLLASLGIVGLAVSFGAQSLVKDMFSWAMLLGEDQCRVGEEISVVAGGTFRGTVVKLGIRSLVLREGPGALHFVPYGNIASLTNHARGGSSSDAAA